MSQIIYKNGCWDCLKARQDPQQKYICPKVQRSVEILQRLMINYLVVKSFV